MEKKLVEKLHDWISRKKLAEKLYNWIGRDVAEIEEDVENYNLTESHGHDGKDYLWYYDGISEAAIRIEDGKIIGDPMMTIDLFE